MGVAVVGSIHVLFAPNIVTGSPDFGIAALRAFQIAHPDQAKYKLRGLASGVQVVGKSSGVYFRGPASGPLVTGMHMALQRNIEFGMDENWLIVLDVRDMSGRPPVGGLPDGTAVILTAVTKKDELAIVADLDSGAAIIDPVKARVAIDVNRHKQRMADFLNNAQRQVLSYQIWIETPAGWASRQMEGDMVITRSIGFAHGRPAT
jgi:hypothetical protein